MSASVAISIQHISMLGKPLSQSPGFKRQLSAEARASTALFNADGIKWRTVLLVPEINSETIDDFEVLVVRIPKIYRGRILRRFYLWKYIYESSKHNDVVLVRHSIVDPFECLGLRVLKNIAIVHHTKSSEELREVGHPVLARVEEMLQWFNRRWARWPIGVTEELAEYASGAGSVCGREMVLPNGIDLSTLRVSDPVSRQGNNVDLLFVASEFISWHGLDVLFDALREWIPKQDEHITVHLVGSLSNNQQRDASNLQSKRLVIKSHGKLSSEEISNLTHESDIGLGSFALSRKNMRDACTLKVREYLAEGLPVYSGHRDSGLPLDFPYYRHVSTISVQEIIEFATESRSVDRGSIRSASEPYISKTAIMRQAAIGMLQEIKQRNMDLPAYRDLS